MLGVLVGRDVSVPSITHGARRRPDVWLGRASMRKLAAGVTVLLAVALMAIMFGRAPAVAAPGTLTASWTRTLGAGPGAAPASAWSMEPWAGATVGDLFGDGRKEVVVGTLDGGVWVLDGATGAVLPGWPRYTGGAIHTNPTVADLNNDGREEVIVASESGWIFAWNGDASLFPGWPQHPVPAGPAVTPGFSGGVAVGDLYGNGEKDLVIASWDQYLWAFGRYGNVLPGFPIHIWDTGGDTPTLVDLEHHGQLDIVVGFDSTGPPFDPYPRGGEIWAFRPTGCIGNAYADQSGCAVPGFPVWMDETPWSSSAAGDLFGNGQTEIIAGTGFNFGPPSGEYVMGLLENGWRYGSWPARTLGQTMGSPAIGDLLGNGGREVVDGDSYGNLSVWDGNGNLLPGWPVNPGAGQLHSDPTIGPINGTHNGIWLMTVPGLDAYDAAGHLVYHVPNLDWGGFAAPAIADLGDGQESVITLDQSNRGSTAWTIRAFPIPGATTMLPGAWPTFHGNSQLSGQMVPTATMSSLPSTEGQTSFPLTWNLDPGSPPATGYTVWVEDQAAGRWTRYGSSASTSITFSGSPGHSYRFTVQASNAAGSQDTGFSTNVATTNVWDQSGRSSPFNAMYAVDGSGALFPGSSAPVFNASAWPDWNIARGIAVAPGGEGGYTLDAYGGVHPFGNAPAVTVTGYWNGWDIARGIALRADGKSGYVLDGWGGAHPFGPADDMPPNVQMTGSWPGWDMARDIQLRPDGVSGYVLDAWGGVHPFGAAGHMPPSLHTTAFWPNWGIAHRFVLNSAGTGGYVLDGYGVVHPFGSAPSTSVSARWASDVARGVTLVPGSNSQGYVVDAFGGFHPFGGAPDVSSPNYSPGDNVLDVAAG